MPSGENSINPVVQKLSINDTLKELEKGTVLRKLRRHGNQINDYKRNFKLDLTQECITWHEVGPKSKKADPSKRIFISQIKEVLGGQQTELFIDLKSGEKLASKKNRFKTKNFDVTENCCFSIIFKNHSSPLDLIANDTDTATKWIQVITYLLQRKTSDAIVIKPSIEIKNSREEKKTISVDVHSDVASFNNIITEENFKIEQSNDDDLDGGYEMVPLLSYGGAWSGSWYKESCVLLFGDTGLGKSTLLNLVTGHSIQTGDGANGTTDVNKIYDDLSHPERPKWMDTVGLNEARYNEDPFDVYQTYLKMLKTENINCIHAVIWAIPISEKNTSNIQKQAVYIQSLFESFGQTRQTDVWKNVILVCRGTFNKNDFQGAHAAITEILKDNGKRARNMTCINMLPFEEGIDQLPDLSCDTAQKVRLRLEEALGDMKSPLYLNFCDMICLDCGQKDDPRLMDNHCHLGQEIIEEKCCCTKLTRRKKVCKNENCRTEEKQRSEWKRRKVGDIMRYNEVDYKKCALVTMVGNMKVQTPTIPSYLTKEKHNLVDPDSLSPKTCRACCSK